MDRYRVLPLTMEEVLDDSAFDSPKYYPNMGGYDKKVYPLLLAPPPTPTRELDDQDQQGQHDRAYNSPEYLRWDSFSSDGSSPSMVDDNSDSNAEPPTDDFSPKTTDFLFDQYEKLWGVNHEDAGHRPCRPKLATSPPALSPEQPAVPQEHSGQPPPKPGPSTFPGAGKLTPISAPAMGRQPANLHRSHAQRTSRRAPNTLKTLPPTPKRGAAHLPRHSSKNMLSAVDWNPLPSRREHVDSPHRIRPSANPCHSSQPFSFHNTAPLPRIGQVEKSVFEYDSDDEMGSKSTTRSSSLASKLHLRSVSLGSKRLGFMGGNDSGKQGHKGSSRRRSATEIVRSIFGMLRN